MGFRWVGVGSLIVGLSFIRPKLIHPGRSKGDLGLPARVIERRARGNREIGYAPLLFTTPADDLRTVLVRKIRARALLSAC